MHEYYSHIDLDTLHKMERDYIDNLTEHERELTRSELEAERRYYDSSASLSDEYDNIKGLRMKGRIHLIRWTLALSLVIALSIVVAIISGYPQFFAVAIVALIDYVIICWSINTKYRLTTNSVNRLASTVIDEHYAHLDWLNHAIEHVDKTANDNPI